MQGRFLGVENCSKTLPRTKSLHRNTVQQNAATLGPNSGYIFGLTFFSLLEPTLLRLNTVLMSPCARC